jgi:hypothetical protein
LSFNIFFLKIDRGFLELLGPLGFTRLLYNLSLIYINIFQNGYLKYYLRIYLIFILFFINIFYINLNLVNLNVLKMYEIFIFIVIIENLIEKNPKNRIN